MKPLPVALALALFLAASVAAEEERTLAEKGVSTLVVEGAGERGCLEVPFAATEVDEGTYPVFSLKAAFSPARGSEARIEVFLNGERVAALSPQAFYCGGEACWARVRLPRAALLEQNALLVCASAGHASNSVRVLEDSLLGAYELAVFEPGSLVKEASVSSFRAGQDVNVRVSVTNTGTREANIVLKAMRERAHVPAIKRVLGQTSYQGVLAAGQTRSLTYTIRIVSEAPVALPPAVLRYRDRFGEPHELASDPVLLSVEKEQARVEPVLQPSPAFQAGAPFSVEVVVHNRARRSWQGLTVVLEAVDVDGQTQRSEQAVPFLDQGASVSARFSLPAAEGALTLRCNVFAAGEPEPVGACAPLTLEPAPSDYAGLLAGALVLAVLAVLVYAYLHTR